MSYIGETLKINGINPSREPGHKYVYIVGPINGPFKIGVSVDLDERIKSLQTNCTARLKVHYVLSADSDSAYKIERLCHRLLAPHRVSGEWFSVSIEAALETLKRAAKGIATDPDGNSQSIHRGSSRMVVYVSARTKAAFAHSAIERGISMQDALSEALELYKQRHPLSFPGHPCVVEDA